MNAKSLKVERLPLLDISEIWRCACGGVGEFVDGDSLPRPNEACYGEAYVLACRGCAEPLFSIAAKTVNGPLPDQDWVDRYFYENELWTVPTTVYRVTQGGGWHGVPRAWVVEETFTPEGGMLHEHLFPAVPVLRAPDANTPERVPIGWDGAAKLINDAWPVALTLANVALARVALDDAEIQRRKAEAP